MKLTNTHRKALEILLPEPLHVYAWGGKWTPKGLQRRALSQLHGAGLVYLSMCFAPGDVHDIWTITPLGRKALSDLPNKESAS